MTTAKITPEDMEKQVARFSQISPSKRSYSMETVGVPGEAYGFISDNEVYVMMAPAGNKRSAAKPAITGVPGLEVLVVECEPGRGPALHAHTRSIETFMCLTGRYELIWGDEAEHSIFLDPFDMFSVPTGVYRRFRNAAAEKSKLLVLVQGGIDDAFNDVYFSKSVGDDIEQRWGTAVKSNFSNIGVFFDTGQPVETG